MSLSELLQTQIPDYYRHASKEALTEEGWLLKKKLGSRVYIPGHHYQRDEVIQFADDRGDSLRLAQLAAAKKEAEYIIFCGVHFMAETADILTDKRQKVILPDHRAGCAMADMATIHQLERGWKRLQNQFGDTIIPMTYINSTAEIKAFCGRHGGATLTSSNAGKMMQWAFSQKERILFLPDQHLGRNTGVGLGIPLEHMVVWDPIRETFEGDAGTRTQVILWKGYCTVHELFTEKNVADCRKEDSDVRILVHPECNYEVVRQADFSGSTKYIIDVIDHAPAGSHWAIGTEMNLVNRLKHNHPDLKIRSLNPMMCSCLTMNRIDLPHLVWSLAQLEAGDAPDTIISVPDAVAKDAVFALKRMLEQS
ncbi:quinolinate synthase NadA [Sporolactobacillus shoreicorticis]|uniref:Quinolinate synthase n=1 Tax=Sporolactobacillus shoreicorticis TaxID=1923877 RepID=A0ABW5S1U5_9BACL|nr:quinolinate synthase NadA [Sporolactobacillus shoreicorticis]MCO7127863.1 quinolinate synthase NadA [Sporolactobacillus shoreicorticis]